MKKSLVLLVIAVMALGTFSTAHASSVQLYLDTAPNAYSSTSGWAAFRDAAYASIYNGSFTNQAHSFSSGNIGSLNYEVEDYMVYSWGDFGKRLHAFYYIEGETVATLTGHFQVSIDYVYGGVPKNAYTEVGWPEWVTPTSWVNYDGNGDGVVDGVMGSIGNALESTDPANLASDLLNARYNLGDTMFKVQLDSTLYELTARHTPVPIPPSALLLAPGLFGFAAIRRRLRK